MPALSEIWAITPGGVIAVALTTVVMYGVFLVLVRVMGRRSLAAMAPHDVAGIMAFGAVLGRTALLSVPTLAGGVVAMVTLFVLQRLLALAQKTRPFGASLRHEPVLLMAGSDVRHADLLRARVTHDELRQRLRLAGITRLDDVAWVVLEANGQMSVARRGSTPDPFLVEDIPGYTEERFP
ncbi:DUF421 domain-containing protein [Amycolatopsis sp. FDAARGOS 1241]|uniref:DUF421 domain-containing protein n=1 Tax=Amycolatopsis sp. FDAARGOS 1241 TaxID=2778070 RepID=UPI00194DD601|nr:YetF domain-containing protein [Amycolatopsis sp. FDAARGOS 1241]QRP48858.1 DUF421 domain-containing protein [Amycolatopsis sp. FDAARGOS 1241]